MKGSTLGLIVICVLVLLISGVFAFKYGSPDGDSIIASPRGSSSRASSLSNVKQLSLGLLMYAADYDDKLPVQMGVQKDMMRVVMPYVKNPSIFSTYNPNGGLVEPNEKLAAAPITEIRNSVATVMLFEANDWPDGKRIIGHLDGHVKFLGEFDRDVFTEIDITEEGKRIMDETALEIVANETKPAAPPKNSLGMPGG